jgi:alpha-tubulin suppressor-like RCC1 family protein
MAYTLKWTDPSKTPILLSDTETYPVGDINNPTSLTLLGRAVQDYYQGIQENFLSVLERFAYPIPPTNPVVGQLWFNTVDNSSHGLSGLYIFTAETGWKLIKRISTAPVILKAPIILGSSTVGTILRIDDGTWGNAPSVYTRQWYSNGVLITGAITSSYTTSSVDVGNVITCTVTASNAVGSTTVTSNQLIISQAEVGNSLIPTITGTPTVGSTLTVSNGNWTNSPTSFVYQWNDNNVPIASAIHNTYTLLSSQVGDSITCTVTASNSAGSLSATTTSVTVLSNLPINTDLPIISGNLTAGTPLTISTGTWLNSPTGFSYQWYSNSILIPLATASTYFTSDSDAGSTFTCKVTATNINGTGIATSVGVLISTGTVQAQSLFAWGNNFQGSLGLGDTVGLSSPTQIGSLTTWKSVDSNDIATQALKNDGTLWSWGYNLYGRLGYDVTQNSSPVQIGADNTWTNSSVGYECSFGIKSDGTLWSWGGNSYGDLGLGDTVHRSSPVQIGTMTDWKLIKGGGAFALAVKNNGSLWSWGHNYTGVLGTGDTIHRSSPVQIGSLNDWALLCHTSFGNSACCIKTDGTLWSWGYNSVGQLGLNDMNHRSSPTQVGTLTNWKTASCGALHTIAIKKDGTLWSWGMPNLGQLGLGDYTYGKSSPTQVGTLTNWSIVKVGEVSSLSIKTDGTLWSWGGNDMGQLGLGDTTHRSSPVQVGSLTTWTGLGTGLYDMFALSVTPGGGGGGGGGGGTTTQSASFVPSSVSPMIQQPISSYVYSSVITVNTQGVQSGQQITISVSGSGFNGDPILVPYAAAVSLTNDLSSSSSFSTSPAITANSSGVFYLMLRGMSGITQNQTTTVSATVYGSTVELSITTITGPVVDQYNNTLWSWGYNYYGELGLSTIGMITSSPAQVGTLSNWATIDAMFDSTSAIKTDGTLWSWGLDLEGALGLGYPLQTRSSPTQVGSLTNWKTVSVGEGWRLATKTDGTLWSWGQNVNGQLGVNDTTHRSSPVQVGSSTNWSAVEAGASASYAIKTDGTLWSWGYNADGELGVNDRTDRHTPVQVGALTNWTSIFSAGYYHMLAIKTDGTLWSWGWNGHGQLGLNNRNSYSSPTQVGSLTTWSLVAGGYYMSIATKTDGTLWSWGTNYQGQLGLGASYRTSAFSSPVQVGTTTTWKMIDACNGNCIGLQTDGTLWAWGSSNTAGGANIYVPTKVGSDTNWKSVNMADRSYFGIKI